MKPAEETKIANIMDLYHFAFSCFIYYWITDEDAAYKAFLKKTEKTPNLNNHEHREALLKFLNEWQCRQLYARA